MRNIWLNTTIAIRNNVLPTNDLTMGGNGIQTLLLVCSYES